MMTNRITRFALVLLIIVCAAASQRTIGQFSKATVLLTGKVTDAESNEGIRARLSFIDPSGVEKNKVMSTSEGKFTAVLMPGISYTVKIVSTQRYTGMDAVSFPAAEKSTQASHDFSVKPIHTGRVLLNEVSFDRGSTSPRSSAATATVAAGKIMSLNDEIEVTIETWSDEDADGAVIAADQGTQRAEALKKMLRDNGAPANRIITKPHNPPPPPPPSQEQPAGKGKKKAKAVKKPKPAKKPVKGKKGASAEPAGSKATIVITKVHSEDE